MVETIIHISLCVWLAVLGTVLGSFLDCAVSRWAVGEDWRHGRSRCMACGHTLSPGELIPVVSYLLSRGHCRRCGAKIPARCLAAELAGAAGLVCTGLRFGLCPELGQWAVFAGLLLALSLTDWTMCVLPNRLVLSLAVNRAIWVVLLRQPWKEAAPAALVSCAVPAALLALVLLAERLLGREVMGGGDIKLLFALALYLSWAQMLLGLLAACLFGLAYAALTHKGRGTAVPFGPFLAAGAVVSVCFGNGVIAWYLGLF